MRLTALLAIARLARRRAAADWYSITYSGDGLSSLSPPEPIAIYRPPYQGSDLAAILRCVRPQLDPQGRLIEGNLQSLRLGSAGKGAAQVVSGELANLSSCWLCIERERLAASGDLYVFQLIGLPVFAEDESQPRARVKDYFEAAGGGVLVLESLEDGREAMAPFHPDQAKADLVAGKLTLRYLQEYFELS
ncbi:MAG: hypothetical protein K1X75_05085 [Leptospirales bacterium]|nr:hypothetical protein [Leptospirales bacterium]